MAKPQRRYKRTANNIH